MRQVLADYGISARIASVAELQRYDYDSSNAHDDRVRLIAKVEFDAAEPVVVRFKREDDVTLDSLEAQSSFAQLLYDKGIATPWQYRSDGRFATWRHIGGCEVLTTVEQYVTGEIRCVDAHTARQTGELLARMHNVAERAEFHVASPVLFDPLSANDLFEFDVFKANAGYLAALDAALYSDICDMCAAYIHELERHADGQRYAVQGDISDCNTYRAADGTIGVFDFNRCGDNDLFFDAIMQAVFEARLMDYPESYAGAAEPIILPAFLCGYAAQRPFTAHQRAAYPYLYSVIDAFWSADMRWSDNSLSNAVKRADEARARAILRDVYSRLRRLPELPVR